MTKVPVKKPKAQPAARLKIADRCDRCKAQAFVAVLIPLTGEEFAVFDEDGSITFAMLPLMFCGHHYRKHADALPENTVVTADDRHLINTKPTDPGTSGVS